MTNSKRREILSLSEAARQLGCHSSTMHRWRLTGVRGVRLRTSLVGGRRFVRAEDIEVFLAALNGDQIGEVHHQPRVDEELDRHGL